MFSFFRKKIITHPTSLIGSAEVPNEFIAAIKRSHYDISEDGLLECISDNRSKNLVYYATIALRNYGTLKSIPILKSLIDYPKEDVKLCSVSAIGAIAGGDQTEYFAKLLDGTYKNKVWVMAIIWEVGDERALASVMRLAEKILKNQIRVNSQSDILYVIEYLEKYGDPQTVQYLVKKLKFRMPELNPW